jgi:predicted unusual protein kinase regulating ubiquinone biosynthesis (AarF/ABC1/UbiB family)
VSDGSTQSSTKEKSVRPIFSLRYWRLVFFFTRAFLHLWILDYIFPRLLNIQFSKKSAPERHRRLAQDFRELATEMGGVLIKLGQFLSSRVDLMPPEVIEELSGLQDEVEPVDYEDIVDQIESNLGKPPDELFTNFQAEPIASASLGQVHLAGEIIDEHHRRIRNHSKTAVKVQRPNIRTIIETDLAAVRWLVGWLKYIGFIRRRADLDALYDQFSGTLRNELNYKQEAKNAEVFSDYTADDPGVEAPSPHWDLTTGEVLVLDQVDGIKITNYEELEQSGISRTEVAKRVQKAYLEQIYTHGFFHADPHPGNIFVRPDPKGPEVDEGKRFVLVFVDFGMVGEISTGTRTQLRQLLVAVINQDFTRIVELAKELGFLLPEADDDKVVEALQTLFERYYGITLGELADVDLDEIEGLLSEFRDLLFEFPFQVPQDFILLGRCLGILNGLTTGLDPDFKPVEQIENFARDLVGKEAKFSMDALPTQLMQWVYLLSQLPNRVQRYAQKFEPPIDVEVNQDEEQLRQLDGIRQAIHRLTETLAALSSIGGGFYFHPARYRLALVLWTLGGILLVVSWGYRTGRSGD